MHFTLLLLLLQKHRKMHFLLFYNLYNFKTELMTAHLFVEEILMLYTTVPTPSFWLTIKNDGGGVRGCSASLHYHYIIYANYKFITWTTNGCQRHHHHHRHPLCNKDTDRLFLMMSNALFSCYLSLSLIFLQMQCNICTFCTLKQQQWWMRLTDWLYKIWRDVSCYFFIVNFNIIIIAKVIIISATNNAHIIFM